MARSLQDIIKAQFGVKTQPVDSITNIAVGVTVVQILSANPNRVGLVIQNNGASTIYIKTNRHLAVGTGIRLVANGGGVNLSWDRDFHKVASPFYAIGNVAGGEITISEVVIYATEKE
jgi:hypothetical protein